MRISTSLQRRKHMHFFLPFSLWRWETQLSHSCGKHHHGEPLTSQDGVDSLVNHVSRWGTRQTEPGEKGTLERWLGYDTETKAGLSATVMSCTYSLHNSNIYLKAKDKIRYCTMCASVISGALPNNLKALVEEILNRYLSPVADTVPPDKKIHLHITYKRTCSLQIFLFFFSGTCPWAKCLLNTNIVIW